MFVLRGIVQGKENEKEISEIDDYLFGLAKPKEYSGKKGAEVAYVKRYEEMSLALTKYSTKDAKKMIVLEYYQAYQAWKKENKPAKKRRIK